MNKPTSKKRTSRKRSRTAGKKKSKASVSKRASAKHADVDGDADWPRSFDRDSFLSSHGLSEATVRDSMLSWSELDAIFVDCVQASQHREATGNSIVEMLRQVPGVHSLKMRVKDPLRVLEKIVRKTAGNSKRSISASDYASEIPDLVGIRILHLFKDEWQPINDFIHKTWELAEDPVAYYREGDPQEVIDTYSKAGARPEAHEWGYRSVHFVVRSAPTKQPTLVEIQVRTLFEEAWSEIDHRFRYRREGSDLVGAYVAVFGTVAGFADQMGTFITQLIRHVEAKEQANSEQTERIARLEKQLEDEVARSDLAEKEKESLVRKLKELRAAQEPRSPAASGIGAFTVQLSSPSIEMPAQVPFTIDSLKMPAVAGVGTCTHCGGSRDGLTFPSCDCANLLDPSARGGL